MEWVAQLGPIWWVETFADSFVLLPSDLEVCGCGSVLEKLHPSGYHLEFQNGPSWEGVELRKSLMTSCEAGVKLCPKLNTCVYGFFHDMSQCITFFFFNSLSQFSIVPSIKRYLINSLLHRSGDFRCREMIFLFPCNLKTICKSTFSIV